MSNRKLTTARQCCPHCGGELAPAAPRAPRRSAGGFADHDCFVAAFAAAAARATAEAGARWMLDPAARVMARVPAAWVNYRVHRRAVAGRRDMALPAARFWPEGKLPIGPDYAPEPARRAPGELHRIAAARCERDRDDALHFAAIAETTPRRHHWIGAAHAAERTMLANLRLAAKAEAEAEAPEPAPEPTSPEPVFVLAITTDDDWRREECYCTEAEARGFLRTLAEHPATQSVRLFAYPSGRLIDEYRRPEPEPVAPEEMLFRLAIDNHEGRRQEFYPTEAMGRRALRVLAGYPETIRVALYDRATGDMLDEYRRPEPAPVPAAPAPVQPPAAPSAPVAPPAPRQPVQPRPEPPANPILLAWWHDAVANWRAYQSPADHAALTRCQDAIAALLAALPDAGRREPMIRAVKAGRAFPARWFTTERNTG